MHVVFQLDASSLAAVRCSVLTAVASSCPLELLQLRNCTYLGDEGVAHLVNCSRLRHLDLSGSLLVSPNYSNLDECLQHSLHHHCSLSDNERFHPKDHQSIPDG